MSELPFGRSRNAALQAIRAVRLRPRLRSLLEVCFEACWSEYSDGRPAGPHKTLIAVQELLHRHQDWQRRQPPEKPVPTTNKHYIPSDLLDLAAEGYITSVRRSRGFEIEILFRAVFADHDDIGRSLATHRSPAVPAADFGRDAPASSALQLIRQARWHQQQIRIHQAAADLLLARLCDHNPEPTEFCDHKTPVCDHKPEEVLEVVNGGVGGIVLPSGRTETFQTTQKQTHHHHHIPSSSCDHKPDRPWRVHLNRERIRASDRDLSYAVEVFEQLVRDGWVTAEQKVPFVAFWRVVLYRWLRLPAGHKSRVDDPCRFIHFLVKKGTWFSMVPTEKDSNLLADTELAIGMSQSTIPDNRNSL